MSCRVLKNKKYRIDDIDKDAAIIVFFEYIIAKLEDIPYMNLYTFKSLSAFKKSMSIKKK